ncbi:hypothetical protein ABFA07_011794 [Porites harrisoni]
MVMDKVSKTGLVTFLDDGQMTATLAEFLLQLQGGLIQGSSTQGALVPRGSVLLSSNYVEPERLVGRVIRFPFQSTGGYSKDVEHAISMLMSHVQNNKGLLTLWAVRNDSLFQAAIEHNIVSGVSAILSEALPAYQPRWLKGVARVIVIQAILYLTTRHPITLLEIIQQHVSFQDTLIKKSFLTPLQKIQLAIYSDIKANPSKSMVLSWLHPSVNVNTQNGGGKSFVPGIGIRAKSTDRWPEVSRQV